MPPGAVGLLRRSTRFGFATGRLAGVAYAGKRGDRGRIAGDDAAVAAREDLVEPRQQRPHPCALGGEE